MEIYEIERRLQKVTVQRLRLVLNNETDPLVDKKWRSLRLDLVQAQKQDHKERLKKQAEREKKKHDALATLTKQVNRLCLSDMEKYFSFQIQNVWNLFCTLLEKQRRFSFGNEASSGVLNIKQVSDQLIVEYNYYCHDRREFKLTCVVSRDINTVLKSIIVISAEDSVYKSHFGHGSTEQALFQPEEILGTVLRCFLEEILGDKKKYYKKIVHAL